MSLSAWKMLRDKPREVQERAAELDNPTVIRCRIVAQEAQQTPPGGVMAAMLDQMSAEHTLVAALGEARARLLSEWHKLTEAERTRAAAVVEAMSAFIGARADAQMEGA